jgi:hypothetical protein
MYELRQAHKEWFKPAIGKFKKYFYPASEPFGGRRRRDERPTAGIGGEAESLPYHVPAISKSSEVL